MKLFVGRFSVLVIRAIQKPRTETRSDRTHSNFHSGRTVITVLIGHLLMDGPPNRTIAKIMYSYF